MGSDLLDEPGGANGGQPKGCISSPESIKTKKKHSLQDWSCLSKSEALTQKWVLVNVNRICINID